MSRFESWKSHTLLAAACLLLAFMIQPLAVGAVRAQAPQAVSGVDFAQISPDDMRTWLSYLASDELQGRQVFTEGYGLAAQYVADRLKEWGVEPLGADGTYFQPVKVRGYQVTRNSSVTVTVNGESRTFAQGDHVQFGFNSGGDQTLTFDGVQFVGNGQDEDYQGVETAGKLVVWMPSAADDAGGGFRGRGGRGGPSATAINGHDAAAVIGFVPAPEPPTPAEQALEQAQAALGEATQAVTEARQQMQGGRGGRGGRGGFRGGRGGAVQPDITSVQKVDNIVAPQVSADETFYEYLLSGAPRSFADLAAMAARGDSLPTFAVPGVEVTIEIDNTFDVVSEQLTKNVVGMVEGSDPALHDTYVLFGAHRLQATRAGRHRGADGGRQDAAEPGPRRAWRRRSARRGEQRAHHALR